MLSGKRPNNLGVQDGKLAACPDTPNCVSTQAVEEEQRIAPLAFTRESTEMEAAVRSAILALPRTKIVSESDGYFHAECRSLLLRFIDDLEIWIDVENNLVHARSASRTGYSDLGVNRERVEGLFQRLR